MRFPRLRSLEFTFLLSPAHPCSPQHQQYFKGKKHLFRSIIVYDRDAINRSCVCFPMCKHLRDHDCSDGPRNHCAVSHQKHESPVEDHQNAQKTQQSQSRRLRATPRQGPVLSSSTGASLREAGPTARK